MPYPDRHQTSPIGRMSVNTSTMAEAAPDVRRETVEQLWADLIAGRVSWRETSIRAEALVEQVNSENPLVNEGLLTLYYLRQPGASTDTTSLTRSRDCWHARMAEHDANPEGWMRAHFQQMLASHAGAHGEAAARTLGAKLVDRGALNAADVAEVLGS